jgi:TctA family transporter
MGRTLATTTQLILNEQKEFTQFRRALRRSDQAAFDELFAYARQQVAAITMASHALPFETILLAMLLGEHSENRRLRTALDLLREEVSQFQRTVETLEKRDV